MVGLLLRIFGCATGAATVRYFFMIVDPLFSLDTRRLGCWGGGWEPNFLRAPGQKKNFFLENPESLIFISQISTLKMGFRAVYFITPVYFISTVYFNSPPPVTRIGEFWFSKPEFVR